MGLTLATAATIQTVKFSELFDTKGNHRQDEAFEAVKHFRFVLYGGAAGGGKSWWLRWANIRYHIRLFQQYGFRNTTSGLFCEDYPTLRDRQIIKLTSEAPAWLGELKEFRDLGLAFRLHERFGGGAMLLRNLDDPSKYNSSEFSHIGVDELTRNTAEVFEELRKRIRWPGTVEVEKRLGMEPGSINLPFMGGTNPGGIGHKFVKQYWIESDFPPEMQRIAKQFKFIPALASDNHMNPPNYKRDNLDTLTDPAMRKALAEGSWDLIAGQFFDRWRKNIHVCKPFKIPYYWKRWCASDWGYAKPWVILWFALSPWGQIFIYRQLSEVHKTAPDMMALFRKANGTDEMRSRSLDPACWDDSRGLSIADQCAAAGISWEKASNARIDGWTKVRGALDWEKDGSDKLIRPPILQVFDTCPTIIRSLPANIHSGTKPEDLDTDGDDHDADALRYGMMKFSGDTTIPLSELPAEYAAADVRARHREKETPTEDHSNLE